jgi:hypothetical protein
MSKLAFLLFLGSLSSLVAAEQPTQQPVFIVLYSRFYDHSHQHTSDERLQRLLPMLDRLHNKYPQSGISALFQFSGTVSELLAEENHGIHLVDQILEYSHRGLVDVGYTGEDEPSYLNRPQPNLLLADTPEDRWSARGEAARRFLTDFKNPVTGQPVPGLSGGLKRTQEVFGNVSYISGITTSLGGDSPAANEVTNLNPTALMMGIPGPDPRRGIEGSGFSAEQFSHYMSPDASESPELFWEDGILRLSDMSLRDNRPHSTDEDLASLKKVFEKLDRSHVRVIKLEVGGYRRYLRKRTDGSIFADPLEWLYYHPDGPSLPATLKALVDQNAVEVGYKNDEATLRWLLEEFLPANPASRFISIRDLEAVSTSSNSEVSADQLKALASDLEGFLAKMPMQPPDFLRAGNRFFSLAESFQLFANALAVADHTGSLPNSVELTPMYGPLALANDMGDIKGEVPVSAVMKIAAQLAPKLANTAWKRVPDNSVPTFIQVGSLHLNAAQFLHLMARAYLDPSPGKTVPVSAITLTTRAAFMFPKNTLMIDQSNAWTYKPAPLHFQSSAASAGGQ